MNFTSDNLLNTQRTGDVPCRIKDSDTFLEQKWEKNYISFASDHASDLGV